MVIKFFGFLVLIQESLNYFLNINSKSIFSRIGHFFSIANCDYLQPQIKNLFIHLKNKLELLIFLNCKVSEDFVPNEFISVIWKDSTYYLYTYWAFVNAFLGIRVQCGRSIRSSSRWLVLLIVRTSRWLFLVILVVIYQRTFSKLRIILNIKNI